MEKTSVDVEKVLRGYQCHFYWGLEDYEESYLDPKLQVDGYISLYNAQKPYKLTKRFRHSLFLSYIMFRDGYDGWDKLLENGFRIMENSRDPNYPRGLKSLPSYGSPLYTGSTAEFFAYDEDMSTTSIGSKDVDHDSITDESDHKERSDDEGNSFIGVYVAAEHIFYSLNATILFRIGSSPCEVLELLSNAVHMDDMIQSDRAALLCLKAITVRQCGDNGLHSAVDILNTSVLIDPGNWRWYLSLVIYLGEKRRLQWGRSVDNSEIQSLVQVIDSILQHDLEPWMRVRYQFYKFQALTEMLREHKVQMSVQEVTRLYQTCNELNETLVRTTEKPKYLSYCAQYYSRNYRGIQKAIKLIEKVLEKKPDDIYVNAKASNIYKKGLELEKALECAEKAATGSFGSCWQVFELKIALNHAFDYEEYFCNLSKNYPRDKHVRLTHRGAASFYVVQGDFQHALAHFKALLDMYDSDDHVYGEMYCAFNCKSFHTVEAAYNVAMYVLSSDYEHNVNERSGIVDLCDAVREEIEETFDLDDFKYTGSITPKQYIEWVRQKRVNGVSDNGPGTTSIESQRRLPDYYGNRHAEGERSNYYQDRGSIGRYSTSTEPSNYKYHFKSNREAEDRNENNFGRIGVTALHDHPPYQIHNRVSRCSGKDSSSAKNMRNYFGKLESSAENTPVDCAKTRITRPQTAGMNPCNNQRNCKPELLENWRSRSDSAGRTRRNYIQSSSRKFTGSSRNWRERDN